VWRNDDYYALTLYDNHEEQLAHIWFDVKLLVKQDDKINRVYINNIWTVKAMVDTGATISGITSEMVKRMKLKSEDKKEFTHAKGTGESPIYVFDVIFPGEKLFENIEAVEIDGDGHSDFLIGMNILSQGDMAITSVDGYKAFSFRCPPAEKFIDFMQP
jgi:predicted aspartyl protease